MDCIVHGVTKSQTHLGEFHFHFHDIGPYSQGYVLPVVVYGCESWTIKKAEHQWIKAFKLSGAREDSWEDLRLQGDPTSPF